VAAYDPAMSGHADEPGPPCAWVANRRDRAWTAPPRDPRAIAFHRGLPGYAPTPLTDLPDLAGELDVGRVFAKDESQRLGLPAFKALGASWAVRRAIDRHDDCGPLTIVTATDGNHGRAIARFARGMGHASTVFVPRGVHPSAVAAIRSEGALVVDVDGSYDDAVAEADRLGRSSGCVLVQDTAWDGYEEIPQWIVDGYGTLFAELDGQLAGAGVDRPGLVVVPTGVGSLLQAALTHYRQPGEGAAAAIVSVEPANAACVHASLAAGRRVTVPTGVTTMAGLNCGTVSTLAWPAISAGLDAALVTDDAASAAATASLAELGVDAGPCGAAPLAALRGVVGGPDAETFRRHVALSSAATVVLLVTEGRAANPAGSAAA
jgi:diaminopropionate ammonia-lyase